MIPRDFFCHDFLSSHGSNFLTYLFLVLSQAQQIMDQQKYILLYVYPNKEFYLDFYDRGGRGGDAGAVKGEFVILSR